MPPQMRRVRVRKHAAAGLTAPFWRSYEQTDWAKTTLEDILLTIARSRCRRGVTLHFHVAEMTIFQLTLFTNYNGPLHENFHWKRWWPTFECRVLLKGFWESIQNYPQHRFLFPCLYFAILLRSCQALRIFSENSSISHLLCLSGWRYLPLSGEGSVWPLSAENFVLR